MEFLDGLAFLQEVAIAIGLYLLALGGMVAHFLKKRVRGESLASIKKWFISHFKSTLLAWFVTTAMFLLNYFVIGGMNPITYVLLGYGFDSALNKWDKQDIKLGK